MADQHFYRVIAHHDIWRCRDHSDLPIVRLTAGRRSLAINYDDIPALLSRLDQLEREHHERATARGTH